jgi:hypothetical protein
MSSQPYRSVEAAMAERRDKFATQVSTEVLNAVRGLAMHED